MNTVDKPGPLPGNASALETALYQAWCDVLLEQSSPYPAVKDPAQCPPAFLSLLAAERGVMDWVAGDTEVDKRETVSRAFDVHLRAGTREGIRRAVETLNTSAVIKRTGKPYELHVEATLKEKPLTDTTRKRLLSRINTYKSERDTVTINLTRPALGTRSKHVAVQTGRVLTFRTRT